jgi:hypothetical protein
MLRSKKWLGMTRRTRLALRKKLSWLFLALVSLLAGMMLLGQ